MFTKTIVGEPRPAGYDAATIYDWFHKHQGPQPACSAAEAMLKQITEIHADVHGILKRGIEESRAFWTGGAADAARGGMSPIVAWADQIKQVADGAQKQVTLLRDAFFRAKNSVEPPQPEPDPRKITLGFMGFSGSGATDFVNAVKQWQANQEHNVRVAEGYGTSSTTAVQAMAEFAQPVGGGGEVKPPETPPRDPSPPSIPPGGNDPRGGGLGGGAWQGGVTQGNAGQGNAEQGGTGQGGTGQQQGGSENASFVPPPPQHSGPQPWRPEQGGQSGTDQSGLNGAIGGLGALGAGVGLGAGDSARGGTGQGGRGAQQGGGAGTAPNARGSAKPGATPMAGPMAGQPNRAEDEEHQRPSWLVEVDDVFTNDMQRVAPPVIGEEP
ncbi:hypothetical protein NLX83_30825 [Allokutzneria sp. A3M-2-11 16]|uniref:hypothetical protein n=1 Tax=Allokutzneria sp. A3M-2-11 16 TaxID=2962043 RepID=UPI0020B7FD52|nr:hypothetical protein [Allokutzneria sp. A3M-2-11 16]MCP3803674.1 hypothetical protein [Allokutzneria sp. A3M-2-11 16]